MTEELIKPDKKLWEKAWLYAPAVRMMRYRRAMRTWRMIRYWKREAKYDEKKP